MQAKVKASEGLTQPDTWRQLFYDEIGKPRSRADVIEWHRVNAKTLTGSLVAESFNENRYGDAPGGRRSRSPSTRSHT